MIFISSPYSHNDKTVEQERFNEACAYAAYLFSENRTAISPLIIGHSILKYARLPSDYEFWKNYSLELLKTCSEIHVLRLTGWEESIGVQDEIRFAVEHNIDIHYI